MHDAASASPVRRHVAMGLSVTVILLGALPLAGWLTGIEALWLRPDGFTAPLPTRTLQMVLSGSALLALSMGLPRLARRAALASLILAALWLVSMTTGHPLPPDAWALSAHAGASLQPTPRLQLLQIVLPVASAVAMLSLSRRVISEARLLAVTAAGMTLVASAALGAILQTTHLSSMATIGHVSLSGMSCALLSGVVIFVLVADRQEVPRLPPRWSPEMAGGLAVLLTLSLWRTLQLRLDQLSAIPDEQVRALPTYLTSAELPDLALVLGLCVSALVVLSLRLLRSNWQQARHLEHARLTAAFETATDGVWDYDFVTHRGHRSASQLRYLGYNPDAFNADPGAWASVLHPDDVERVLASMDQRSRQLSDDGEMTYRVRAADGSYHTIVDRGRVVERTADGRPRLFIGISADVTERLKADAARAESEQRFRAIFDTALQGQVLLDRAGVCVEVNARALHLVGAERPEVIGRAFVAGPWFTGLALSQSVLEDRLAKAVRGESVRFEMDAHLLDGRIGHLECSLTPLATTDGDVHQVLCELRDVTERRRTEEALREIGALTTMGRLAARVAHEINNPLAGIQNSFLLLADAVPADHPHRRFLQSIEREIQRIASVTRSLYETYRHDETRSRECSLVLAAHDAVTFLDQVNRGRGIRIVTDLAHAPVLVPVPDALLRQTLYNLVQNAVDASPIGGTVTVRATVVDDQCVITVRDEGASIPAPLRGGIFEAFNSGRSALTRTGSMGVGLALVRQSVEALGGRVQLLDGDGAGETFEVRLPMTSVLADSAV